LAGREIIDVNVAIAAPRHRISSSMASNGITRNRGSSSASRGSSNGITNGTTEGGGGGGEAGEEEKDANGGNGPAGETGAGEEMEGVEGVKGKVTTAAFSLAGEAAAVVPTNTNIRRLRTSLLYYSLVYYSLFLVPKLQDYTAITQIGVIHSVSVSCILLPLSCSSSTSSLLLPLFFCLSSSASILR
jgi:hypothetical protein